MNPSRDLCNRARETLKEIVRAFDERSPRLLDGQKPIVEQWISTLGNYSRRRFGMLPKGYQTDVAGAALQEVGFPVAD